MLEITSSNYELQYAPVLFTQAGIPGDEASLIASGVSAILMLAITIPAFLLADKWGRRTVMLAGGAILASTMLIVGSLYASKSVHSTFGAGRWVVIVAIFVFALTYCATWGVVGRIYAGEIQPAETRAAANSLAQGMSFVRCLKEQFTWKLLTYCSSPTGLLPL
jgi:MFS family permease